TASNVLEDRYRKAQLETMLNLTIYLQAHQQYSFFVYRTWIQGIPHESNPMLGGTDILYNLLAKSGTIQGAVATSSSAGPGALGGFGITPLIAPLGLLAVRRRDEEP